MKTRHADIEGRRTDGLPIQILFVFRHVFGKQLGGGFTVSSGKPNHVLGYGCDVRRYRVLGFSLDDQVLAESLQHGIAE